MDNVSLSAAGCRCGHAFGGHEVAGPCWSCECRSFIPAPEIEMVDVVKCPECSGYFGESDEAGGIPSIVEHCVNEHPRSLIALVVALMREERDPAACPTCRSLTRSWRDKMWNEDRATWIDCPDVWHDMAEVAR